MKDNLKTIKITNALWLPTIAEHIEQFCKRAHVDGIQPGNLQTYFAQIAQGWYGKDATEFWMIFEDDKPVAFAAWMVLGLPHISKVYCFALYSWQKKGNAAELLMDEFIKFGIRHNAVWYSADVISKSLVRFLKQSCDKRGYEIKEGGLTHLTMRRKT